MELYEDFLFETFCRMVKNTSVIKLNKIILTPGTFVLNLKEVNEHK